MKKMMKYMGVGVLALAILASVAQAGPMTIKEINFAITQGSVTSYAADSGFLTWSAGASGGVTYSNGGLTHVGYNDATIEATFGLVTDDSAGGVLSGNLELIGDWTMTFKNSRQNGFGDLTITGHLLQNYAVKEVGEAYGRTYLEGQSLAYIDSIVADAGVWGHIGMPDIELQWAHPENFGEMESSSAVLGTLDDFGADWMSDNLTVKIIAIPEPATMVLLGLGGLMIRRKRR